MNVNMTAQEGLSSGGSARTYEPVPRYSLEQGEVACGYACLADAVRETGPKVLALEGPATLDWMGFADRLRTALHGAGISVEVLDVRAWHPGWEEVQRRTEASDLSGDPNFARLFRGRLEELFDSLPSKVSPVQSDMMLVFGPGSALIAYDELWYVDVPKRYTLAAIQQGRAPNLGHPPDIPGTEKRHLFIDWPLLDRHRDALFERFTNFVDATDVTTPCSVSGEELRRTLAAVACRPFRTRPSYLPGSWGGQWLRRTVGVEPNATNVALSYELIAPESGLLLTSSGECATETDRVVEVSFAMMAAAFPEKVMGSPVTERFGTSFPIRFDYLDTMDGGNLSVHCHPQPSYMKDVFGWEYTQHETYYVMDTRPGAQVYLGLHEDVDTAKFRRESELAELEGCYFDVEQYVQTFPADHHQLFLVPAGTPHASGQGNVVLEVSSTPYLYSLRFFDWMRTDSAERLRPVHVEHAFANLNSERRGVAVRNDLIPSPRLLRGGEGWAEYVLSSTAEMFFEVRRLELAEQITDDTDGRFHVLNLVEGDEVVIEASTGHTHPLAYAETIVIPAAAGPYRIQRVRGPSCRIVKALVP